MTDAFPKRLYSLDVLRGLAALSIVVFHWVHFHFRDGRFPAEISPDDLPFYPFLFVLYAGGEMVVDLFFVLSGFVFYWLYSEAITTRLVGAWEFFVLRFSRLYPLHIATLVAVAGMQFQYQALTGTAFVYPRNDLYHFALQLFFASEWGLQKGHSFNGPIWSVSIEVLLYAMFFIACAVRCGGPSTAFALSLIGLGVSVYNGQVGRGMFAFFIGGLTFFAARRLASRNLSNATQRALVGAALTGWVIMFLCVKFEFVKHLAVLIQDLNVTGLSDRTATALASHAAKNSTVGLLFPLTILTLVLIEARRGGFGRRFAVLGEVSYSSYLLHFPLQLLIATLCTQLHWSMSVFRQGWLLLAFYAVLVPASVFVFRIYERPAQNFVRNALLRKGEASSGSLATRR